jgi:pimeloyl-ACP methyl ester carboxylesterase
MNAEQNKALSETKLQIPILALGGDIYPAFGGDAPSNFALDPTQGLAENVKGVIIPLSGHYIAEEQPDVVVKLLRSSS